MATKSIVQHAIIISILLNCQILAYPVFGTKRYGRSTGMPAHRISAWAPLPIQPYQTAQPSTPNQFLAPSYYTDYPYAQDYETEYYYPPEPAYNAYPPVPSPYYTGATANDNLNYAVYHSLLPYYYDTRRPGYAYYGYDETSDPVEDLHEEIQQDEEREERAEALPIGQETWFENSGGSSTQQQGQESIADVNAAFLQNLILSQMYNDAQVRENAMRQEQLRLTGYGEDSTGDWIYGDQMRDDNAGYYGDDEDEDVKELKSLVKKPNTKSNDRMERESRIREERERFSNDATNNNNNNKQSGFPAWEGSSNKESMDFAKVFGIQMKKKNYDQWLPANENAISFSDRKVISPPSEDSLVPVVEEDWGTSRPDPVTTPTPLSTTEAPDFDARRGQKEVPLLRPSMPVRHPAFKDAMDELMRSEAQRNKPSVYDTIKKLLDMEEGLREDRDETWQAQPKKRFVTNEGSLVDQLGGLKKVSA